MKTPSSGVEIGLYVLGAVVGLYVLGGLFVYVEVIRGGPILTSLPEPTLNAIGAIYAPAFNLLFRP